MKTCMVCGHEKPLDQFKMRKRPPIQPYAACRACEPLAYGRKKRGDFASEMAQLRSKAAAVKERNAPRNARIVERAKDGVDNKVIATEFGISVDSVRRVLRLDRRANPVLD